MSANMNSPKLELLHFFDRDTIPDFYRLDFDKLASFMSFEFSGPPEEANRRWAPLAFINSRSGKTVSQGVTAFVMTLPVGSFTFDLPERIRNYSYFAYASMDGGMSMMAWTVIIPLAKPVPVEDWPEQFNRINAWLGGSGRKASKNPFKTYPLVRVVKGTHRIITSRNIGTTLDPS